MTTLACLGCGCAPLNVSAVTDYFYYGTVTLEALIPLYECRKCGRTYVDHRADESRTQAVRAYLATLPKEENS